MDGLRLAMTEFLFREDAYLKDCDAVITAIDERGFQTDRTVFYPTGGGQPGDSGRLLLASGEIVAITNPIKGDGPDEIGRAHVRTPAPNAHHVCRLLPAKQTP